MHGLVGWFKWASCVDLNFMFLAASFEIAKYQTMQFEGCAQLGFSDCFVVNCTVSILSFSILLVVIANFICSVLSMTWFHVLMELS